MVGRRGKRRALIAVGHKILIMAYHILKDKVPYKELGNDYLMQRRKEQIAKNHLRMLRKLGYSVEVKEAVLV